MIALVEGADPDAQALARVLAAEGVDVRLGDLAGPADVAYLDVWTPEVAPRVRVLRERGVRLSCLAEAVLERAPGPVLGVTGTAGKTTTASFAAQLLRTAGREVLAGEARAGNLWPTGELLEALPAAGVGAWVVAELTSSHLAFMSRSPQVAVVTCFWPDHVELHGSVEAYRRAKETIVRHQDEGGVLVVPSADPAVEPFARLARGAVLRFGETADAEGVFVRGDAVVAVRGGVEAALCAVGDLPGRGDLRANALAAAAAALAAGVPTGELVGRLPSLEPPPYRLREAARIGGVAVIDDGMAATPAKTAAALRSFPARSVVLLAGGLLEIAGGRVHSSPEEEALLREAGREVERAAARVVVFGEAGERIAALLPDGLVERAGSIPEGLERALAAAPATGAQAVLFSPMFPILLEERVGFRRYLA